MAPLIKDKRYLVGVLLVSFGILLVLDNIRYFPDIIPWWFWSWQFLLLVIGVFSLLTSENRRPGIVLIAIGTAFLLLRVLPSSLPGIFDFFIDDSGLFWYAILIIIGLALIFRSKRNFGLGNKDGRRSRDTRNIAFGRGEDSVEADSEAASSSVDYIDEIAIFGGGDKIVTSDNFRGGKITTVFGGADIILLHSKLAPGINQIEVFSIFGGWTLRVPPNWHVKNEVLAIFGGISDKRYLPEGAIQDNTRQLIVKGFVMFGGGEIK
jgi:hypothetical protein